MSMVLEQQKTNGEHTTIIPAYCLEVLSRPQHKEKESKQSPAVSLD